MHDGRLVVRVTAPPAEGKANEAVRRLIAKRLGVAKSRVTIVRGARSRDKTIRIERVSRPLPLFDDGDRDQNRRRGV
jgi:uncharacterized protein (TIGR00251 family)